MSDPAANDHSTRPGRLYGGLAFASVVLVCYIGYFPQQRYYTSEWMVPVSFGLGAIYLALGVFSHEYRDAGGAMRHAWLYYLVQCALLTAILIVSPSRGFLAILTLPVVSQAVLDLKVPYAAVIALYLYATSVAMWAVPVGWSRALQSALQYAIAFIFTIAITTVAKQALATREREKKLREEVELANGHLRELAEQAEELATIRERNRVAREIHDGVGHYLTVIKTQLDAAAALLPSDPNRAGASVEKAAKLAGDALDEVRRSVGSLRADTARVPLSRALRTLADDAGLPVNLRVEGVERILPATVEHALYRTAQEGLTNVRKHSSATRAELELDYRQSGRVQLSLTDNGGDGAPDNPGGFGLRGIRERIEILGGRIEFGRRSETGFTLTVEVPA